MVTVVAIGEEALDNLWEEVCCLQGWETFYALMVGGYEYIITHLAFKDRKVKIIVSKFCNIELKESCDRRIM